LKTAAAVARRCFENTRAPSNCNGFVGVSYVNATVVAEKQHQVMLCHRNVLNRRTLLRNTKMQQRMVFSKKEYLRSAVMAV